MLRTWRTVRVFISSTFRDMHAERDHLIKIVFPALRERLEKHRVHLVDIDLRWGVTKEQAENDQALDVCLRQIDECRPYFIGILGQRYGWIPEKIPAEVLDSFGWVSRQRSKSVTELEILHGVLNNPEMSGHAFFYFRDPDALNGVPADVRNEVYAETEPHRARQLEELKEVIRESGYPYTESYPALWDPLAFDRTGGTQGRLVDLETFGELVMDQLWRAIEGGLDLAPASPADEQPDPLLEEADYHWRFIESRLRVYSGREELHQQLRARLRAGGTKPLLVTGPPGSGKSAALARLCRDCYDDYTILIPHFVGASPHSTSVRRSLHRFCATIQAAIDPGQPAPDDLNELKERFRDLLGRVPRDTSILIVIDGVDQLGEAGTAGTLAWLPASLPANVGIVYSCVDDVDRGRSALVDARRLAGQEFRVGPLTRAEQADIIRRVPSLSAKSLDKHQVGLLLANPAAANPLFLLVALEELRGFGSYEKLNARIAAFPRGADATTAIFKQVIERLAGDFDAEMVRIVLAGLAASRRGLSEAELRNLTTDLTGGDDLYFALRQLRPYLTSRGELIGFYHHNLLKAVVETFMDSPQAARAAHAVLASYFEAQPLRLEGVAADVRRPVHTRKVDELVWQHLHAEQWDELELLLEDLPFLEAKAEAGMVFGLAHDFVMTLAGLPPERRAVRVLRLLLEAIRRDLHFIQRRPSALFQCLWNSCWWYDSAESAFHHEPPVSESLSGAPHDKVGGEKLSRLLERWRLAKESQDPGFVWLRSLRPPSHPLGDAQSVVFAGHEGPIGCLDVSPDGQLLVSGADDGTVRIWDAETGAQLLNFRAHAQGVTAVAFSPDGNRVISGGGVTETDHTVRVWNPHNGDELLSLNLHKTRITGVGFSSDGRLGISSGNEEEEALWVWDARTGEPKFRVDQTGLRPALRQSQRWAAVPGSNLLLLLWLYDPSLQVLDLATGLQRHYLDTGLTQHGALLVSGDGKRIIVAGWVLGGDCLIQVYEVGSTKLLGQFQVAHRSSAVSYDGSKIACGLDVHDLESGSIVETFYSKEGAAFVAFSPDGMSIYSAGGAVIRKWQFGLDRHRRKLKGPESYIRDLAFSPDGVTVATTTYAGIDVWSCRSGEPLLQLRGICDKEFYGPDNLVFSADGRHVFAPFRDSIKVWDAADGCELSPFVGRASEQTSLILRSPDGMFLATWYSVWRRVFVWDARDHRFIGVFTARESAVGAEDNVAFSADSRLIAFGSDYELMPDGFFHPFKQHRNRIRVFDLLRGREPYYLIGHDNSVMSLHFSPDSRHLLSGSLDGTARVWDLESGAELLRVRAHPQGVKRVRYSPDGGRFFTGDYKHERASRVWDAITGQLLHTVEGVTDIDAVSALADANRAVPLSRAVETSVAQWDTGRELTWLPETFHHLRWHDQTVTLAGVVGTQADYLHLYALEGRPAPRTSGPEPSGATTIRITNA